MAHQYDTGAIDASPSITMDDAAMAFADEDEINPVVEAVVQEDSTEEFNDEPIDGDSDNDAEEAVEEDGGEPAKVINAPASLNADEKAVFTNAPPEVQEVWAANETRRNQQVQEVTTRAANREANAEKLAQHEAVAGLAQERLAWLENFRPQAPDPQLAYSDPNQYNAEKAQFDAQNGIYSQTEQELTQQREQAQAAVQQEFIQQRNAELKQIPEVSDEASRAEWFSTVEKFAQEVGYPMDVLAEDATAHDLKMLHDAAKWKADSDELAKVRERSRQRKRDGASGRFKSIKPGAAQSSKGSGNRATEKVNAKFRSNPSNMKAAAAAFEDI